MNDLTPQQLTVVERPLASHLLLHGPAGTGKTTAGVERLRRLMSAGVAGESILVLTSHRILLDPYLDAISTSPVAPAAEVLAATMSALAWQTVQLFWPLAARAAGFAHPEMPPTLLNVETAQYYMAAIIRPLLAEGYFETVTVERSRICAQILDDLNRSATVGFPYAEIGSRLESAWAGDPSRRHVYAEVQECASRFRRFCLEHNLLDYSLLTEVFAGHLWPEAQVRSYLTSTYRHLIYDNVEEGVPRDHDVIGEWLPSFESALLIYDDGGGYRRYLGADAETGAVLAGICDEQIGFTESFVISDPISRVIDSLSRPEATAEVTKEPSPIAVTQARFIPEMVEAVVAQIATLIDDKGVAPSEIVVLAPLLSDALRFAVTSRLDAAGIQWRTLRPSRPLHTEPAAQVLLTLAALAHPHWNSRPSKFEVAYAFMFCLEMDLVRAQMLAEIVYRAKELSLSPFDRIHESMRDRISFTFGDRYAALRDWLLEYREQSPLPLDIFLRRLCDDILSQPGFGFHRSIDAARIATSLIDSIHSFRLAVEPPILQPDQPDFDFGLEYVSMLREGVLPALYLDAWRTANTSAVLVAPAYSFLLMNRPSTVQFWLDAGSGAWSEGLAQPLTQPYVLTREWTAGRRWTFADAQAMDARITTQRVIGLLYRCRRRIVLAISNWSESGFEQRGPMLRLFQHLLEKAPAQVDPPKS